MSANIGKNVSFASLDREKGYSVSAASETEEYPLPKWYRSIREKPLQELGIGDIAKACRQRIHLEYTVPLALDILHANPMSGDLYDGELVVSLKEVPDEYWQKQDVQLKALMSHANHILEDDTINDDLRRDIEGLLRRFSKKD